MRVKSFIDVTFSLFEVDACAVSLAKQNVGLVIITLIAVVIFLQATRL